jgi:6-phospho-beta-glucosidase
MAPVKVVVLGGSGVATPQFVDAILQVPDRTQPVELVLVGRSEGKLETVARICKKKSEDSSLLSISHTTDVEAAFTGADYVVNQIRVGGMKARAFDESFPHEIGLPGEETVGPGGFANASRTIPVSLEYARQMEAICPDATLLSFANPSSLVQYAMTRYTRIATIGLCDSPVSLGERIARALGVPLGDLIIDYVGMHHFGWVTGVWRNGHNLLPQVLEKAEEVAPEVDPQIIRAIGALPGSYLNYVFHPDRLLDKKMGKRPRAEELGELYGEILEDYERSLESGDEPAKLEQRKAVWYDAIVAPVLMVLIEQRQGQGKGIHRFILDQVNNGAVPWLPAEAIVEVPTLVAAGHLRPLTVSAVPIDVQRLMQNNCTYEMLAVEAIVERDREKALRALLVNPIIHTYDQAATVLERAWADL